MLSYPAQYIVYHLFGAVRGSRLSSAQEFLIYDTVKIFFILWVIIFAISFLRSFFLPEKTRNKLSHKKDFIGNILTALPVAAPPFCSRSTLSIVAAQGVPLYPNTAGAIPIEDSLLQKSITLGTAFALIRPLQNPQP